MANSDILEIYDELNGYIAEVSTKLERFRKEFESGNESHEIQIINRGKYLEYWNKLKQSIRWELLNKDIKHNCEDLANIVREFKEYTESKYEENDYGETIFPKIEDKLQKETEEKINTITNKCKKCQEIIKSQYTKERLLEATKESEQHQANLNNTKWMKGSVIVAIIAIIISASLARCTINVTDEQKILLDKQTELINISNIPNAPEIVVLTKEPRKIESQRFVDLLNKKQTEDISICLANRGRISSGTIDWRFTDKENIFVTHGYRIQNIPGGDFSCTSAKITPSITPCTDNGDCTKADIPKELYKKYDLIMEFECNGPCNERKFNSTIKICVWEKELKECED